MEKLIKIDVCMLSHRTYINSEMGWHRRLLKGIDTIFYHVKQLRELETRVA